MTAPTQVLLAASGSSVASPAVVLSQVSAGSAASPNIQLNTDGSLTVAGNGSSANPPNWYLPTTAGIGTFFWCQLTYTGTAPDGGANTVFALSSPRLWQWTQTVVGIKNCTATISFYTDAAATQPAGSFSFNVTSQRTS